jgi:hypothetical protein
MRRGHLSGSLYRLIYYSRNLLAARLPQEEFRRQVGTLVEAWRQRNASAGLTGCLLTSLSGFAQVLEGSRDVVERTFDRIAVDDRHTDVMLVSLTPIERPSFPATPLALAWQAEPGARDPLRHLITDAAAGLPRATTGADVLRMLRAAAEPMPPLEAMRRIG